MSYFLTYGDSTLWKGESLEAFVSTDASSPIKKVRTNVKINENSFFIIIALNYSQSVDISFCDISCLVKTMHWNSPLPIYSQELQLNYKIDLCTRQHIPQKNNFDNIQ